MRIPWKIFEVRLEILCRYIQQESSRIPLVVIRIPYDISARKYFKSVFKIAFENVHNNLGILRNSYTVRGSQIAGFVSRHSVWTVRKFVPFSFFCAYFYFFSLFRRRDSRLCENLNERLGRVIRNPDAKNRRSYLCFSVDAKIKEEKKS